MGWSLSWAALKGGNLETVCSLLGLRPTGKFEGLGESKISGTALAGGWYVVVFNRTEINDRKLKQVSPGGEVVGCFVEEHVMFSSAACWKDGQQVWRVFHNGGDEGAEHLETSGRLPAEFESIRKQQFAKQQEENAAGDELGVDHVFEIPLNLAKSLTGFRHDDPLSGLVDDGFEALETAKPPTGFFGRLFGRGGNQ
ncbi:MAG TPA: hypothetical protein VJN93_10900 [Candidatus Acidoferrum sp.]|nr:hypothetical protein [Candidatus Acidoferrum sp.]